MRINDFFAKLHQDFGPVIKITGVPFKPDVIVIFDPDEVANVSTYHIFKVITFPYIHVF